MKKVKFKIIVLLLILIFIISSNLDISSNSSTHYNNNDKEDDLYTERIHLTQSPINSSSNWWNSLYNYRIPINITNMNTENLPKGYSVNISVNTADLISDGKLRTDGKDLRIVWYNSSNKVWLELDRVNESNFNAIDTRIWFKAQDIIYPGTSDINYYLYYGNPNAFSPPMNRSKIYDFFDDFTQPNGTANGWENTSGNSWTVVNNQYRENEFTIDRRSILNSYFIENSSIEVHVMSSGGTNIGLGVMFRYSDEYNFYTAGPGFWDNESAIGEWVVGTPAFLNGTVNTESVLNYDQWYDLRIDSLGSEHWVYLNNSLKNYIDDDSHLNAGKIGFMTYTTSSTSYFDDLKIRLLVPNEPILSLGSEEIYRHSSNDFLYYKIFTVNSSKVIGSTNLIDFPLLISIEDPDLRHHCQPDGDDIAFSNGTIWLDHEIELFNQTFNGTHAKLVTWIRIPSLSPTMDTNITMYYGNSTMNSQENPKGVWNTNYKGVWHLKEDPSISQIKDSTSNFYHGTSYGSMTSNDQVEGQIGGSVNFDGLNDYINLGSDSGLRLYDAFTIEAWYSGIFNTTVDTRDPIYCNGFSYSNAIGIRVQAFHSPDSRRARITIGDGTSIDTVLSDNDIPDNDWTHLVCTYDGTTFKLYINGTKQIDQSIKNINYNANDAAIGANLDASNQRYKGKIDELRVINTNFTSEWILTEYNNQYEPNSFYLVSAENLVHNYLPHENYFTYYKIITINHTQVSGDGVLLNFPLLLSIIDSDLRAKVQADGDDIAFAKDNIWLDHEIEVFNFTYSPTESQLIAWVGIPFLSGVNNTQFRMYYGNSTMNSQENPSGIWDANTFGVWHLSEIGNGTIDEYKDSGKYSNHGQGGEGDLLFVPTQISGILGCAQDFNNLDGKYDLIDCGNNTIFDISGNQITLQAWIKHNITPQAHFYGIMNHKGWYDGYSLWIEQNSLKLAFNLPGDTHKLLSATDISTNTWHHIVATYDGSYMRIYIDGTQDPNNLSKVNNIEPSSSEKDFWIGHGDQPQEELWSSEYEGQIDEVRISNIARSGEWIATEYNNQYDPNSFYSIGIEYTTLNHPPNFEYFKYYKEIVIDHTKINGTEYLINFPVLINILDSDMHDQNKIQADGYDIAFGLNNLWLDHEIEYFNQTYSGTQAKLVAWVRIPSLSPFTDTIIKLYYGNSTMGPQENPTGVWDSNCIGIYHLNKVPTGIANDVFDSTFYGNDGITNGSMNGASLVNSKIGMGFELDGIDDFINISESSSLDSSNDGGTLSLWITWVNSSKTGMYQRIMTTSNRFNEVAPVHKDGFEWSVNENGDTFFYPWGGNGTNYNLKTNPFTNGIWHHVSLTFNYSSKNVTMYLDGSLVIFDIVNVDTQWTQLAQLDDWLWGASINVTQLGHFEGKFDEIRISNITRSADWIATEYNNQYDPDSFYTIGTETQVEEDTLPPELIIILPNPNDLFGWSAPDYDLTVFDANLDSIWYTLNDGFTNSTPSTAESGTIDQTLWEAQENGTTTIRFYANDTLGNLNYEEVIVRKDIANPSISIDSPSSGSNHSAPPSYSLSITEANLDKIWYSLDGGSNNYTGAESGTIDSTAWSNAGQGAITIIFYVNDSAGNWNSTNIQINRDTIVPSIDSIDSPLSGEWFNSVPPNYSLSITEVNLDEIWYSLDGGSNNYTGALSGTINSTAWSNAGQGAITITFYVNDSAGNWNSASVQINRDTIAPTIIITEPNNYDLFGITPPDITININDLNLDERWYQLDNGTVITNNYTWTGLIAQSVWDQVGNGTVTIRFYANDTAGNLETEELIVYKDIYLPIIIINSPNYNDVFNSTAPSFIVAVSGSNLDARWYTLDGGLVNYTFTGLSGIINSSAWGFQEDGPITIIFYINNTLGIIGFDEITIIKDTLAPQITINLPLNNTYCGTAPIINIFATDPNLDAIWYRVNTTDILLGNNISQQLDASIWSSLPQGEFYIYIYANDSVCHVSDPIMLILYKDTIPPLAPELVNPPQGEINLPIIFNWADGDDPSGIVKYRLIIDTEPYNPFATPGFVFEINITGNFYEYSGTLQPGTYYFFLYQIDGAGNQSPASTGNFSIGSSSQPSEPSEFPIWIIIVIIGAAIAGVVGFIVLKKAKSKKVKPVQIPQKKPGFKPKLEIPEELKLLEYETLKSKTHTELNHREKELLDYIDFLEKNKDYTKAAEFSGELVKIEEILANTNKVELYRQKQIDIAIKGLDYLKDQYEIESKNAAITGDYSKALELYKESKLISDNLKIYVEGQESSYSEEGIVLEPKESQVLMRELEIVYSCINDLLTKYFDEIGIKYYSNPQIYDDIQNQIHGLILNDNNSLIADMDPSIKDKIKSIQIIYTEDISNENIIKLCKSFQNPNAVVIIVGIKWPKNIDAQTIEIPSDKDIKHQENVRIIHYELFSTFIGLKGDYEIAFKEIIQLYYNSEFDILRETHESSAIIIHSTDELFYDLKEKGLIEYKLQEYFHR